MGRVGAVTTAILRTWHDQLNPGGWPCIADLEQEDGSFHGTDVNVHRGFERAKLVALAKAAGFAEPSVSTVLQINKEQPDGSGACPVFLLVARKG